MKPEVSEPSRLAKRLFNVSTHSKVFATDYHAFNSRHCSHCCDLVYSAVKLALPSNQTGVPDVCILLMQWCQIRADPTYVRAHARQQPHHTKLRNAGRANLWGQGPPQHLSVADASAASAELASSSASSSLRSVSSRYPGPHCQVARASGAASATVPDAAHPSTATWTPG